MGNLLKLLDLVKQYGPLLKQIGEYLPVLLQILKSFQDGLAKANNMEAMTMAEGDLDVAINQKVEELALLVAHKMK